MLNRRNFLGCLAVLLGRRAPSRRATPVAPAGGKRKEWKESRAIMHNNRSESDCWQFPLTVPEDWCGEWRAKEAAGGAV